MLSVDILGYLAGVFLILMASMKTQFYMRAFNIAGNGTFILYGWFAEIWPVLVMNSVMVFIHLFRIVRDSPTERAQTKRDRTLRTVS